MAKSILIDFSKTNAKGGAKGMAEAAKLFEKAGEPPLDFFVDKTVYRSQAAKRSYRKALFIFEDAQKAELWISFNKADPSKSGGIFKVKLGGAGVAEKTRAIELPIKEQDDHPAAIKEIVAAISSRKKSFAARLEKLKVPRPPKMTTSRVSQKKQMDNKLAEIRQTIKEVDKEIDITKNLISQIKPIPEPAPEPAPTATATNASDDDKDWTLEEASTHQSEGEIPASTVYAIARNSANRVIGYLSIKHAGSVETIRKAHTEMMYESLEDYFAGRYSKSHTTVGVKDSKGNTAYKPYPNGNNITAVD